MIEQTPAPTRAPSNVLRLPEATRIGFARRIQQRISARMNGETADRVTVLARNEQLRAERLEVWKRAAALTEYFHAMARFNLAVRMAQREGIPAARHCHPTMEIEDYTLPMREYRMAHFAQLLTPAPDVASVCWKRRQAFGRRADWDAASLAQIKASIVADEEFLKSHPVRQPCRKMTAE